MRHRSLVPCDPRYVRLGCAPAQLPTELGPRDTCCGSGSSPSVVRRTAASLGIGRAIAVPQNGPVISTDLRQVDYHDTDAQLLIDEVQQEYVRRYGGPDGTPVDRDEFSPPNGHFVMLYEAGRPVAMGGWRFSEEARARARGPGAGGGAEADVRDPGEPRPRARPHRAGPPGADRRRSRRRADGAGDRRRRSRKPWRCTGPPGTADVPAFGHYADSPDSIHLGKRLIPAG